MELGPDSFITSKPEAIQLCEEIAFADQLIPTDARFRRSLVLRKGNRLSITPVEPGHWKAILGTQ